MDSRYLYKAIRSDNKEWVEGYLLFDEFDRKYRIITELQYSTGTHINADYAPRVITVTICQCTGMPDKKGDMIWENDKCRVNRPCVLVYGTIKYLEGGFCFVEDKTGNILRLCDVRINNYEIECLGNIFD